MNYCRRLPGIFMSNVRSLRYKTDELAAVLEANNIDISCITETWLDSNIPTEAVDINEYTLKSVQVRRARTLQALNWASKFHVSRAKVGLLRLKCSGVERQLANSGNKQPNEPPSSVQWFRELTRTGSAAHRSRNSAQPSDTD
jgi:hypothetical protein